MRKLKVGYWPLSIMQNTPGDRRRLMFWAEARGHKIVTDLDQRVDVIVASENADFNSPLLAQAKVPIVFDLIDAYLSPLNATNDLIRGIAKKISGQISGAIRPFSDHIKHFCLQSSAVICSSIEQQTIISAYCSNTHVILDSHEELPLINPRKPGIYSPKVSRILWEGQPATIRGIKLLADALTQLSESTSFSLELVTDETYFKFLNRYLKKETSKIVRRDLKQISRLANITPWSPRNLVDVASQSSVGVLPLDLSIPMQKLKPENRLLLMWRLGIPCLTSPSPAYQRVADAAGVDILCESSEIWLSKLEELIHNPNHALQEVLRGQNYLSKMHTRQILLNKWDQVFESVL